MRQATNSKHDSANYNVLVELFECVESLLGCLTIHTDTLLIPALSETVIRIMAELLRVLSVATKQVNEGRFSTCRTFELWNLYSIEHLSRQIITPNNSLRKTMLGWYYKDWRDSPRKRPG